ncbi:sialoadhesin-like [Lineus longissimus]|uniref:sialoadhesin-like n=1 Tax=Lineus longissimus TaxID=88925 RepID=UPI002B4DF313
MDILFSEVSAKGGSTVYGSPIGMSILTTQEASVTCLNETKFGTQNRNEFALFMTDSAANDMVMSTIFHIIALLTLVDIEAAKLAKPTLSTSGSGLDGSTGNFLYLRMSDSMSFTCVQSEAGIKEYQWLKDGVLLQTTSTNLLKKSFAHWTDNGVYTCKVIASSGVADNSDLSEPVAVKAGGPLLGSRIVIVASDITSNAATITWAKPTEPSDSFTSYKVVISPATEGATASVPSKDVANPSSVLTRLQPYTIYTVTVSTVTEFGSVKVEGYTKVGLFLTRSAALLHGPAAMSIYFTGATMVALFASVVTGV